METVISKITTNYLSVVAKMHILHRNLSLVPNVIVIQIWKVQVSNLGTKTEK
jgi:hypothetical protein